MSVRNIRNDGGTELISYGLLNFQAGNYTRRKVVPRYSPEANGYVERCRRTVMKMAITLISELRANYSFKNSEKL